VRPLGYYERALRAIGQDLADLFPQQLEIEYHADNFEVQVRCDRKRAERKGPRVQKPGLRDVLHKLATYELGKPSSAKPSKEAEIATFAPTYSPDDINQLNESGMRRRAQAGKVPDIRNLSEALRTVGRIIDAEEGRLIKVFRDLNRIAFECMNAEGATRRTEMTHAELYKLQQQYYQKRGDFVSVDVWKGHESIGILNDSDVN
jgi:hypothetical protein